MNLQLVTNFARIGITITLVLIGLVGTAPQVDAAPAKFMAVQHAPAFELPPIVLPYDPATKKGFVWERLSKLNFYQAYRDPEQPIISAVGYLREAVQRMTGKELPVESQTDLSRGIVLTTLELAPPEIQKDAAVQAALCNTGEDAYNANEAFFVRTEPNRVIIVANTIAGLGHGVVELLESVKYEVLGMGPNWIHVPDFHSQPLSFNLERGGRPGFYIRQLWAASGQDYGIGTLLVQPLSDPADETVEVSYERWRRGTRLLGRSMPEFPGHSWQKYHRAVADKMLELNTTEGFLTEETTLGPDAERPPATPENNGDMWVNTDPQPPQVNGKPAHARVFVSDGKTWTEFDMRSSFGGLKLDISVPFVREMMLDDLKARAQAHFAKEPRTAIDKFLIFGTDPEDESRPVTLMRHKNWYPEYLQDEKLPFGLPYVLHGFKNLNQPREIWDSSSKSDVVFAFNNWLLREYDKWIDSLPAAERVAPAGESKKDLVRASLYSYASHDVPPNFNLDPRIRISVAGYPQNRGFGKWKSFATHADIAAAFRVLLPREPAGDYWVLSLSYYRDHNTRDLRGSHLTEAIHQRFVSGYEAGFRAIHMEMDFNFGRQGLEYYLYSKLLWNPKLSVAELDALRDRWLQRSFGNGWLQMKEYYDFMAPENFTISAPNMWAQAIRLIEEADKAIDDNSNEQKRLDDLKQFWYVYYLMENGKITSDPQTLKEFLWKGQMSYMTAMHAVARRYFKTYKIREIVGEALSNGPAHYTREETSQWWARVLDFWQLTPVSRFADATLANGKPVRSVDLNDMVAVEEFQSELSGSAFFYNSGEQKNASVLTVASQAGEEVGFKLYWPYNTTDPNYREKNLPYGISRWDTKSRQWIALLDETTTKQQSVLVQNKNDKPHQLVEVRYRVAEPGTYRIKVGSGGLLAMLTTLNYDVSTDTFLEPKGLTRGFTFHDTQSGHTQSPTYIYISKGTKSFDLEVWGNLPDKELQLFQSLLPNAGAPSRTIPLKTPGTQNIELLPGEDGTIAVLKSNGFYFPFIYSVPLLWAKTPQDLLVPRAIAEADGLTIKN